MNNFLICSVSCRNKAVSGVSLHSKIFLFSLPYPKDIGCMENHILLFESLDLQASEFSVIKKVCSKIKFR